MAYWNEGGFFKRVVGNLIKWWQIVIMPVFRLNNNRNASDALEMDSVKNEEPGILVENEAKQDTRMEEAFDGQSRDVENNTENTDAEDILRQWEKEQQKAEEQKRQEIEAMRKKNQEEERIAEIMNAGKVDLDGFIATGKAKREQQKELEAKKAEEEKKQEELRRAQEIIDRLNREAAEDAAKKQEEIEQAKQEAEDKFG